MLLSATQRVNLLLSANERAVFLYAHPIVTCHPSLPRNQGAARGRPSPCMRCNITSGVDSFSGAGQSPYACVLLRIESDDGMRATISRWFTDRGDCSADSPWFASGFGDPVLGPSYLLLEADTSQVPPDQRDDAMKGVKDIIGRRAEAFGVPVDLRREGSNRLSAVVQGIGPGGARELFGRTAELEFKEPQRDVLGVPSRPVAGQLRAQREASFASGFTT